MYEGQNINTQFTSGSESNAIMHKNKGGLLKHPLLTTELLQPIFSLHSQEKSQNASNNTNPKIKHARSKHIRKRNYTGGGNACY